MGWTYNEMKIEMKNAKEAEKAIEIIKEFMIANSTESMNVELFNESIYVDERTIMVEESYSMRCTDHFELIPLMCKAIAEANPSGAFKGTAYASSSYPDDTLHQFSFKDNTLEINSWYFPNGDMYYCPDEDCCGFVCHYEDFEADEDGVFVCEECGTEYKFSELEGDLPEIIKKTYIIK